MFINPFRKRDLDRRRRSSNIFSKKEDTTKVIGKRLQIMILIVCLLFVAVGARLVQLQLVDNQTYAKKLETFTAKKQTFSSPRGNIYDRNHELLAKSEKSLSIFYYPPETISNAEEWKLAEKFVDEVGMKLTKINDGGVEVPSISERQLKDMYYLYNVNNGLVDDNFNSLLTKKQLEQVNSGVLSSDEAYNLKIEQMELPNLDDRTKKVYLTKMLMDQTPESEFKTIIEDATNEQASYLVEHNSEFPGFTYRNDWTRKYYGGEVIKSILGNVSSQTQGLPKEDQEYYTGLGYSMNQRVGVSGLEKEYENWLTGTKTAYDIKFDEQGVAYLEEEIAGKKGYDLNLTIDMDLQRKTDEVLKRVMKNEAGKPKRDFFKSLYFVAINPNTGEILAMDSVVRGDDGTISSSPTGTYLEADRAGSIVKMATLYMGLDQGVVKPGEVIVDAPMYIKGSDPFASYVNHGPLNDLEALAVSSNVYMATIAIRMAGGDYVPGEELRYDKGTFEKMRTYYNMFGLGVKTGIDLPNEEVGSIGGTAEHGKIMPMAIGQFDTYTPMQLAQYVATVANGGKRVQPHLLKDVREVNDEESIIYDFKPNVLSTLLGEHVDEYIGRSQQGMRGCVVGVGNQQGFCTGLDVNQSGTIMAAKSGTAENKVTENGKAVDTTNSSMVAYGPYDNPEIAFVCLAPNAEVLSGAVGANFCADIIAEISKYYFENKK